MAGEQLAPMRWIPAQRDKVIRLQLVDIGARPEPDLRRTRANAVAYSRRDGRSRSAPHPRRAFRAAG
jgi:hypothetical protein